MNLSKIADEFLSIGGKRLRPRLFTAVCEALGEKAPCEIAEALECFHKASLVHDDIQDEAVERYSRPCLHRQIGTAGAIACGDILVAKGYKLIATFDHPSTPAMLAQAARSHERLCLGQAAELSHSFSGDPSEIADILEIYEMKTGEGFALAAALGAIFCGCGGRFVDAALAYGRFWGVAYQIQDDLADGEGPLLEVASRAKASELCEKYLKRAQYAVNGAFDPGKWWV